MIWTITACTLYAIITGCALFLICGGEETNDGYYDIRNILTALFWPVVLLGSGLAWMVKRLAQKNKTAEDKP